MAAGGVAAGAAAGGSGAGPGAFGLGLANERLRILEELEREIGAALQSAGTVILELSKEKPNERLLERHAGQFAASLQKVESELSAQIRYLTQLQVEPPMMKPDATAANNLRMKCQGGQNGEEDLEVQWDGWGQWGSWSPHCPGGLKDDTALNDVRFFCCC